MITLLFVLAILLGVAFVGFKVLSFITSVVLKIVVFLLLLGAAAIVIMRLM